MQFHNGVNRTLVAQQQVPRHRTELSLCTVRVQGQAHSMRNIPLWKIAHLRYRLLSRRGTPRVVDCVLQLCRLPLQKSPNRVPLLGQRILLCSFAVNDLFVHASKPSSTVLLIGDGFNPEQA